MPHIIEPGWHNVMPAADLPDSRPVRKMLGETPIALVRSGSQLHALADRCSHMSGQLSESDLVDGCLTCPWHGSVFRVSDGSVARVRLPRRSRRSTRAWSTARFRYGCPAPADDRRVSFLREECP